MTTKITKNFKFLEQQAAMKNVQVAWQRTCLKSRRPGFVSRQGVKKWEIRNLL
jgi:hypothetical protein